jgi:UDPglucose--hexose-1-phosphate uridylyltransferase
VSERRFNELRGEEVVYAVHRQDRTYLPDAADCPLCPTRPGGPRTEIPVESFEVAVFENRFPAFSPPEGAAEVVVYTPEHEGSFGHLPAERAEAVMWAWRDRYAELGARPDVQYVLIFENRGELVGTTLHHPHGQIYGYPFVPPVPAAERRADERRGGCTPCAMAGEEITAGDRMVHANDSFAAYVPWAARWPYEVHVTATAHRPSLAQCGGAELRDLADALQVVARAYDALFDRPFPYMMVVHQAPTDTPQGGTSGGSGGHLHVELYPPLRSADKVKHLASGEQGAGTFSVDVMPETAARELRLAVGRMRGG